MPAAPSNPTFSEKEELLSMLRLPADRAKLDPVFSLALLAFNSRVKLISGKTPAELNSAYPNSDDLKLAEIYFVKACLLRDLKAIMVGSSSSVNEVWNEEPMARDRTHEETVQWFMDEAETLIHGVSDTTGAPSKSRAATIGSDDPCVYQNVFQTIASDRSLF